MCGNAGYIGESKRPKITYELMTQLFDFLELRGTDASGIWGVESKKKARVIYHKEPIKSSKFIKTDIWNKVQRLRPNLLLCHARATSPGIGRAIVNSNNHPFVSSDKRIGLIHNGRVNEFDFLKKKYETKSDTDSEVLLRMYEEGIAGNSPEEWIKGIDPAICHRLNGLREIWSVVDRGAMSVALGERIDEHIRYLWLFHNERRPLWIADTREQLGQIFFFSSPEIWYRAIAASDNLRNLFLGSDALIEIPVGQVFFFEINKEQKYVEKWERFNMKVGDSSKWDAGEYIQIPEWHSDVKVISGMNEKEEIESDCLPQVYSGTYTAEDFDDCYGVADNHNRHLRPLPKFHQFQKGGCHHDHEDFSYETSPFQMEAFSGEEHEEICGRIEEIVSNLNIAVGNSLQEGSLGLSEYQQIINSLEETERDLNGTLALLGHV